VNVTYPDAPTGDVLKRAAALDWLTATLSRVHSPRQPITQCHIDWTARRPPWRVSKLISQRK